MYSGSWDKVTNKVQLDDGILGFSVQWHAFASRLSFFFGTQSTTLSRHWYTYKGKIEGVAKAQLGSALCCLFFTRFVAYTYTSRCSLSSPPPHWATQPSTSSTAIARQVHANSARRARLLRSKLTLFVIVVQSHLKQPQNRAQREYQQKLADTSSNDPQLQANWFQSMKEAFQEMDEVFKLINAPDGFNFLDVG